MLNKFQALKNNLFSYKNKTYKIKHKLLSEFISEFLSILNNFQALKCRFFYEKKVNDGNKINL